MATHFDRSMMHNIIIALGQMMLLLSIACTLPSHAAGEALSDVATALGVESVESDTSGSASIANDEASEPTASSSNVTPPPTISGESTNNGQIETTPTLQQDNDIR